MLDSEILDGSNMEVIEKLAIVAVQCLSRRGDDRPTMKEVAESLQMLWRLQMQAICDPESDGHMHDNYGGWPSVVLHLDENEMANQSMETSKLVLSE
ncbi:hypothetical protein GUJ93_ZPchr0009g738 [Zizania palustris]|uniref:Uncharacterized protein n=1 Tax=Zizania palustris TaxID=103762 RepID=A0A8J5VLT1_ZIZPA|nr:hypothetical protein GUJ93_ZPchr0009g738 [Zizania palustris]